MPTKVKLIPPQEFYLLEREREAKMARAAERLGAAVVSGENAGLRRFDRDLYHEPGLAYEAWWLFQPAAAHNAEIRDAQRAAAEDGRPTQAFSPEYWLHWSDKRPPLCVILPNGEEYILDQALADGTGHKITGWKQDDGSSLTASGEIVTRGYRGRLKGGFLSDDLDGRGTKKQGLNRYEVEESARREAEAQETEEKSNG